MLKLLAIFLGGGLGALLRYGASCLAGRWVGSPVPGTFVVNVLGCLALGAVFGLTQSRGLPEGARLFTSVGFLGALTTFSTLNLELFDMLKSGRLAWGITYLLLSIAVGLLFTCLGYYLGKSF